MKQPAKKAAKQSNRARSRKSTGPEPMPAGESKHPEVRYLDIREGSFDEAQFVDWVKQASKLPGEKL